MKDNGKAIKASSEARRERALNNYINNIKKCPNCGKPIPFEQRRNKFCSKSCSTISSNSSRPKKVAIIRPCKSCQKLIKGPNVYCNDCIANGEYLRKTNSTTDTKTSASIRKYLIRTRGNQCEECGITEWRGIDITVQMHHIDGNPDNNDESNLKLLCPNCHSITPNFGARNSRISSDTSRNRKRRNLYHNGHFTDK